MGWRFKKRIKILPGVYINLSKSGISTNIGIKGANVTFGPDATYVTTGIPGTGLYNRQRISNKNKTYKDNILDDNDTIHPTKDVSVESSSDNNAKQAITERGNTIVTKVPKDTIQDEDYSCNSTDYSTPINPKEPWLKYKYPTLDLLKKYDYSEHPTVDKEEQQSNMKRIVKVLEDFGVQILTIHATVGPTITLYEITPAEGVHLSQILYLEKELALYLSAINLHILGFLPGKGTIGIEVPNAKPQIVSMESVLKSRRFQETSMELPIALGKTITNEVFLFDLAKAPHVLISGSSGQGKSNALHTIITSLLYKKHPNELKFVLMAPYGMEFAQYKAIASHFLTVSPFTDPIISNGREAIEILRNLCIEMESRYRLLNAANVLSIKDYNKKFVERKLDFKKGFDFLPYIVVIIDSYNCLVEGYEDSITMYLKRLVQSSRAVGIHIIIASGRPSSDILSSELKSYMPTRISFRVPEKVDSQIILDCDGAEKLIGQGDMLFVNGSEPIRVQCAFVNTHELEAINKYIEAQPGPKEPIELPQSTTDEAVSSGGQMDMHNMDPLFEDAARSIVASQQGSTSMIQRKFSIGYNRAGRLMDDLQKAGIVGEAMGSKPREVLITDMNSLENLLASLRK